MKPIAKKDFSLNGIFYEAGENVEINNQEQVIKLNEKGFIEPLTMKEIQDYFKKPEKVEIKKIFKKEEE